MKSYYFSIVKIFAFIYLLGSASYMAYGQSANCNEKLKRGEELFESGMLDSIPLIIEPCITKYEHAKRIEAYKLLILSYIYLNRYSLADIFMEQLLRFDPEVEVGNVGSMEFMKIYESYRTKPLFGIGLHVSFNLTQPIIVLNSENNYLAAPNKSSPFVGAGFAVGPSFQFFPFRNAYIDVLTLFKNQRFGFLNSLSNFAEVNFTENQTLFHFQPSFIFEFSNKKLKPYLKAGVSVAYLLNSSANVERSYLNTSDFNQRSIPATDVVITNLRQRFQSSILAGFGGVYSIQRGKMYFEIELQNLLHNAIVSTERFSNDNLIFNYFYTDNNFIITNLNINVRYVRTFYKPKKIRD